MRGLLSGSRVKTSKLRGDPADLSFAQRCRMPPDLDVVILGAIKASFRCPGKCCSDADLVADSQHTF